MFVFGHVGITIVAILLIVWFYTSRQKGDETTSSKLGKIDFRFVIVAAMLPDIIDKVVGMIILKDEISNGRLFTHSLIGAAVVSLAILALAKIKFKSHSFMPILVFPVWMHLFLDKMWENPKTLLWPVLGTGFPKLDIEFSDYFSILLSDAYILAGEVLGFILIMVLLVRFRLYEKVLFFDFLKKGKLKVLSESS